MTKTSFSKDCGLYFNTGTYLTPVWVEDKNVIDVQMPSDNPDKIETTWRGATRKTYGAGQIDTSIKIVRRVRNGADAIRDLLLASKEDGTTVDVLILPKKITEDCEGYRGPLQVFERTENQNRSNRIEEEFTLAPTDADDGDSTPVEVEFGPYTNEAA